MTNLDSRDITLHSQSSGFSSSHVQMWELDHKEGWAPKNWCFRIVLLEKTLESSLDCKKIKPVNPKGSQPWMFIGRTEAPTLWPPDVKSRLIWKDSDAGKYWRQKEEVAEGETAASLTQQTWICAYAGRQWSAEDRAVLQSISSQELDTTEQLNNNRSIINLYFNTEIEDLALQESVRFWQEKV